MAWTTIGFGKHKGRTLPQVLLSDPDWFFWAVDKNVFTGNNSYLTAEAGDLAYKARNIKIPKPDPENWSLGYVLGAGNRLWDVMIVKSNEFKHHDFSGGLACDRLNFGVVRLLSKYDKLGGKILLKRVKEYFCRDGTARFTKKWCEQFFSAENNFVWPA